MSDIWEKINVNGCSHGNLRMQKIEDKMEFMDEDYKSYYGSVKAGQELFANEIFPKIRQEASDAKSVASEAKICAENVKQIALSSNGWIKTLLASVILLGIGKIYQDKVNQDQTASFLKDLSVSIAILQEHDKQFSEHIKKQK